MDTITLSATVCPHDTARNLPTWIEFFLVLGQVSGLEIGYLHAGDFPEFYERIQEVDLVYANPLDALKLEDERGFVSVAMPDNYDEVVFITREGTPGGIDSFAGFPLGAVENQFATLLGQLLFAEAGVRTGEIYYYHSWSEVLAALRRGEIGYALLYKDYYDQLSDLSLEGVRTVQVSAARRFAHVVMLDPKLIDIRARLYEGLFALPEHPLGKLILSDLRIGRFTLLDSLEAIRKLRER